MRIFLFFLLIIFSISFTFEDVLATKNHAKAFDDVRGDEVFGSQVQIIAPDMFLLDAECNTSPPTVGVTTQWVRFTNFKWIESGITVGKITTQLSVCQKDSVLYYGQAIPNSASPTGRDYTDYKVKDAMVGKLTDFEISDTDKDGWWNVIADSSFPVATLAVPDSGEARSVDYGIESEVKPDDKYSNIPNTHFYNYKKYESDVWIDSVPSFSNMPSENYQKQQCDPQHFVAGNILDVDCNRPTVQNTAPQINTPSVTDIDTRTKRVTITTDDADSDYLKFYIDSSLYYGIIEGHPDLSDPLPTTTHNSVSFDYYHQENGQENITIKVTDGRPNHDRTVTVSLFEEPAETTLINYGISQDSTVPNKIVVTFDQKIIPSDDINDWHLTATVNPTHDIPINSITTFEIPSKIMYIFHDDLPQEASSISLEYVGRNLSSDDPEYELQPGTQTTISISDTGENSNKWDSLIEFSDDFEDDLSNWSITGNNRWLLQGISIKVPDHPKDNTQLYSSSCNPQCEITMIHSVDLTQSTNQELSFWALASSGVRSPEFVKVDYSINGGDTWSNLDSFASTGFSWVDKSYDLSPYSASTEFKVKLIVSTTSGGDLVLFDDVVISGDPIDTTAPLITIKQPTDGQVFLTGSVTVSGTVSDAQSDISSISAKLDDGKDIQMSNSGESWSIPFDDLSDGTHLVKITATNTQDLSSETFVSFIVDIPSAPQRPTNLIANVISTTQIDLSWIIPSDDGGSSITGYRIERNLNNQGFETLQNTSPDSTTYSDMSLSPGNTVQYRIFATNDIGTSISSNVVKVVTLADTTPPRIDTINRQSPTEESTFDSILTFRVTFNESVTGVDFTDFTTPPNASVTASTIVSASVYDVEVAVISDGTVSLGLKPTGHGIADTAITPNSLTNTTPKTTPQSYTVTLPDTIPPVLTVPVDVTLEAPADTTPSKTGTATATDTNDPNPTVTYSDVDALDANGVGTITRTWSATDDSGNSVSKDQTITIRDTTPPVLTIPDSITISATGTQTPVDVGTGSATDAVDPNPTVTNDATATFQLGTTTVTWSATDNYNNKATAIQKVTVNDTAPPTIKIPTDKTFEATASQTPLTATQIGEATATDDVDPTPTITNNSTGSFDLGNNAILWSATDASGNTATDNQLITIQDTTPPVISQPDDIIKEATGTKTILTLTPPDVTDNSGESIIPTSNAPKDGFPVGSTTVTWSATDSSANTSTITHKITIQDTVPPVFITTPESITDSTNTTSSIITYDTPTATDIFSVTVTCLPASGSSFDIGTTVVTCTATDENNNSSTISFDVIISSRDNTAPVITLNGANPQVISLHQTYNERSATVSDAGNPSYSGTVSADTSTLDTAVAGEYTVTYSADADSSGNIPESAHRKVIVFDPDVNLANNGSFEKPTVALRWNVYHDIDSWKVSWNGNNPHVVDANYICPTDPILEIQTSQVSPSADGTQHMELDSYCPVIPNTSVAISQDVATVPNQEYELSFASKKRINTADDSNGLEISVNGMVLKTINNMNSDWHTTTMVFVADGAISEIRFADVGTSDTVGTLLDSITLTETGSTANLISNGSFEDVTVKSNKAEWQLFGSAEISNWNISWSADKNNCPAEPRLEIQKGILGGANTGKNHAELDTDCYEPFYTSTVISQAIDVDNGVEYELSWHSKNTPNTDSHTNGMSVMLNDQNVYDEELTVQWSKHSYQFMANATDVTISFADTGMPNAYGTLLDQVFMTMISNN